MLTFPAIDFISSLASVSPRLFEGESKAARLIAATLDSNRIPYKIQQFRTKGPVVREAVLRVDGQEIPCKATSFVSGKILNNNNIVDVVHQDGSEEDSPNLNYNSLCPAISQATWYSVPSLAFRREDLKRVRSASRVEGSVVVVPRQYDSCNLLVGNLSSPRIVVFTHYDCLEAGAVDNASGTALVMQTILEQPEILSQTLFVIAGNEELSYDPETYWGYGYRVFEKKHKHLLDSCAKIIVVDGVGLTKPAFPRENRGEYIPLTGYENYNPKITILSSGENAFMSIYHCDLDTVDKINSSYIAQACRSLQDLMKE